MKLAHILKGARGLLGARLLGLKATVVVGMAVTNRCNLRCSYCNIYSMKERELPLSGILNILDQLSAASCIRINLTGGEPLLREDLGQIVRECRSRDILTTVTTNGVLLKERIDMIRDANLLLVSLDGFGDANDINRGEGSSEKTIEGILTAKDQNIPIMISAVLSETNKDHIDELLAFSEAQQLPIHLQLVSDIPITSNNINGLELPTEDKAHLIRSLIDRKKRNNYIANSTKALMAALEPPRHCAAGKLFFRISASGKLYNCWRDLNEEGVDLLATPLSDAMRILRQPLCGRCDIADGVELASIYNLDISSLLRAIKKY